MLMRAHHMPYREQNKASPLSPLPLLRFVLILSPINSHVFQVASFLHVYPKKCMYVYLSRCVHVPPISHSDPMPCVTFRKVLDFSGNELLASRPKLCEERSPLSAVRVDSDMSNIPYSQLPSLFGGRFFHPLPPPTAGHAGRLYMAALIS
jgi:hypothetical protein